MILLASWCALRIGELTELRRGDLDLRHARVQVTRGVTWIDGKADHWRSEVRCWHL
jgi:integrase